VAANFRIQGSSNTTEQEGGGVVIPVQEFAVLTIPSNIYFQFRRPISQLQKLNAADRLDLIDSVASQLAGRIEDVADEDNVLTLSYSQPANAAGQLLDVMTIYVASDSGNSQGTVQVPLANIGPGDYTTSRVHAEVTALNAAEAL
jgi:hypothetical protein